MKVMRHILILSMTITVLCSCEYKDLMEVGYDTVNLTANFDWSKVDSVPQAMRVVFFPDDQQTMEKMTQGYRIFDISNMGGHVYLPTGTYRAIAFNHDTEYVRTDDDGIWGTLYATTLPYRTEYPDEQPIVMDSIYHHQAVRGYPDYMVLDTTNRLTLTKKEDGSVLTFTPDSIVTTVDVTITGIKGLEWVRDVRGAIDHTMNKRFLDRDELDESGVQMFTCQYNDSIVTASFYVWGWEKPAGEHSHQMTIFFWLDNRNVFVPATIIPERLAFYQEDAHHVNLHLHLDVDLREFVADKSGFDIKVEGWENINLDVGF